MNSLIPKIDIRPDHWEIVRDILHKHVPDYEVWAFGSRAKWTAKQYSDLDLAVITAKPLSLDVSANLSDDFSESDLPWKVDIVDWAATQDHFRAIIKRDKVVVQKAKGLVMKSELTTKKLADIIELVIDNRGRNPKSYEERGIPIIDNFLIKSEGKAQLSEVKRFINEETYDSFLRKYIKEGDVLMTLVGNGYGGVATTPKEKCAIIQNTIGLRCNDQNDNQYLYYLLRNNRGALMNLNRGAAQPSIKVGDVLDLEFKFPSLSEQKRVAGILKAIDDKIEVNTQTNQTLEQIAQAIFKSWFVDFDPVKAKIETLATGGSTDDAELAAMGVISAKTLDELNSLKASNPEAFNKLAQTAALFPAAMQDSELGEIPEGWDVSTIGEEVKISGGGTPSTKNQEYWENGSIHWTTPKDLSNLTDKVLTDTERKITESGLGKISSGLLPVDTVLMSSRAPVGYLALAKIPVAINQGYIAMQCERRLSPEFILQWASSSMDEIKQRASGTTFAEISKKNFRPISVVVPPAGVVSAYSRKAKTIYDKIYALLEEIKTLSSIRDTALPSLLYSEIDFGEADL